MGAWRRRCSLLGVLLGSGALAGAAVAAELGGTYSNVCVSPGTGDQGGVELTLLSAADGPSIIFKICEGGCWQPKTHDVELIGRAIAFTVTETTFDGEGRPAKTSSHRFRGAFGPRSLSLESPGYYQRFQLRRVRSPEHVMQDVEGDADPSTWPSPLRRCH